MQKPGRLLLLDSASLYFRAFHGVPESVTAPDGTPVNAVRGFLDTIARLVTERRPARMVACWDEDWRPAFRVAAIPSYKAHRVAADGGEEVPAGLVPQVPVIVDVLAALGIARRGAPGFEADDVIGTLVEREVAGRPGAGGTGSAGAGGRADGAAAAGQDADGGAGAPVEVVTGDRDLFQARRRRGRGERAVHGRAWSHAPGAGRPGVVAGPVRHPPAPPTPTWRSCAATRATGCPASPASGRRPRQRC